MPCRCFWGSKRKRRMRLSVGAASPHDIDEPAQRLAFFILVSLFLYSLLDSGFLDRTGWSSVGLGVEVLLGTGLVPRQRGALL